MLIGLLVLLLPVRHGHGAAPGLPQLVVQTGHDSVKSLAYSPDGRLLASLGSDQAVKLWDAASGKELRTLRGNSSNLTALAFSADGRAVAMAGSERSASLWDLASGARLRVFGQAETAGWGESKSTAQIDSPHAGHQCRALIWQWAPAAHSQR